MDLYGDLPSSYPKEMFYTLSRLNSSMSKNLIKTIADRTTASSHTITNIRLPLGALINLDSLALYFTIDITGTNPTFPARYSSSFIKRLSISMNNVNVCIIQDYNLLYNIVNDFTNKDKTKGICGEFLDNSIIWSEAAGSSTETAISGVDTLLASNGLQTDIKMCINNFLGFFGSASTRLLDTNSIGEILVSIEWAPNYECLGGSAEATSTTYTAADTYNVKDIYMTCEALSFSSDEYYNAIADRDLMIGFYDYQITKFQQVQKKQGINVTTYLNSGSVDSLWGTAILPVSVPEKMVAYGSNSDGVDANVINAYEYLSNPKAYSNNNGSSPTAGDGFFNVRGLQRQLAHAKSFQWSINNKHLNYAPLNSVENFQNLLLTLGYENVDTSANAFHSGMVSLYHFYKYYGVSCQSLELINRDEFYISGLSSQGSSVSVNWKAEFEGTNNTLEVIPVVIAKISRVLQVRPGRQISVI